MFFSREKNMVWFITLPKKIRLAGIGSPARYNISQYLPCFMLPSGLTHSLIFI